MRIGVVGDTHNNLFNVKRIVEIFNHAGVQRVIHTGDITQAKVLDALSDLDATLHGVYGNNDLERQSLAERAAEREMKIVEPPLDLDWSGRRILVVHDPLELPARLRPEHDLALHGHTHLFRRERVAGTLIFNPGECAGRMPGRNAVGVVDLARLRCEVHRF